MTPKPVLVLGIGRPLTREDADRIHDEVTRRAPDVDVVVVSDCNLAVVIPAREEESA